MSLPEKLTDDLNELSAMWLAEKEAEKCAVDNRRRIEDRIKSMAGVSENLEGAESLALDCYKVKITGRIDRKVDADKVQELAAEFGLTDHLSSLFRWKPEINIGVWKSTDEAITNCLAPAITAKPGRPSFSIEPINKE